MQNGELAVLCSSCKSYLQSKVDNLNLFETIWQLIETPGVAFKKILLARHKNYVILLSSLAGISMAFALFWMLHFGNRFENVVVLASAGALAGVPLGFVLMFVASEQGAKPNPVMLHYAMSKAAQISIARGLAESTKGTGVTVNSVLAAATWSEGVEVFINKMAQSQGVAVETMKTDYFRGEAHNSLLQRFASTKEIADQVIFLCSANASAINGAAQRVDGGVIRSMM